MHLCIKCPTTVSDRIKAKTPPIVSRTLDDGLLPQTKPIQCKTTTPCFREFQHVGIFDGATSAEAKHMAGIVHHIFGVNAFEQP